MAVPAGTFSVGRSVGNAEDLQDKIYNIDPTETPFTMACGTTSTEAVFHEWQTDTLAAPDANNAQLEGDDPTISLASPTARLGNNVQILRKTAAVSGTQEAIVKKGRDSEMSYQIAKRGLEMRRDMDLIFSGAQARSAGTVDGNGIQTAARKARGFEHFVQTNVSTGVGYAAPANETAALTDGTQRAFSETLLQDVLELCYTNGGKPDRALMGPRAKRLASAFTGRSSARQAVSEATILASASLFASDFGDIKLIPSLFTRARTVQLIDKDYLKIAYLRRMRRIPLAKRGDNDQEMLICEATLVMGNEKAHGKVADLLTS
jgi:hypothetical protein